MTEIVTFADSEREPAISFEPFRLFVTRRLLLEGDRPVRLGSRALDILIALVKRPGELVTKRELMGIVWPDTIVVEANLTVHVTALRRALGDGQAGNRYIVNIPGRGYRFVAPVKLADEQRSSAPRPVATDRPHNLPAQPTRLIGRAEIVSRLGQQLPTQRLLTIIGPGGIGKTAVALEVAELRIPVYEHGVWLIDLARIADPALVPTALASALGLEMRSDRQIADLIAAVREKKMLLVLDNCEHVIEAAATLASEILRGSTGIQVLATSREPLRVEGERVHRLESLESPPEAMPLGAVAALRFPAVQLFVERVAATLNEFELSDADAPSVRDICRKLDGIPLAIELIATRVEAFGVRKLAARLDDRMRLLTRGRRAALPRHQTIGAALDWSYELLSPEDQTIFRRLAVFVGGFTLEAAGVVAGDKDGSPTDITDSVVNFVMKSLVTADVGNGDVRFRLLETTRAYAVTKLAESAEDDALARSHAIYYRDFLEAARSSSIGDDFALAYELEIDNIRAALTWAFGPESDASIAVTLAVASGPIWLEMSLFAECHDWMGRALDVLDATERGTRREMMLQTWIGLSLVYTQGSISRARAALTRAGDLAESVQDLDYQLRSLMNLCYFCCRLEDFHGALVLARRAEAIPKDMVEPVTIAIADCMLANSLFFLGDYPEALTYAQRAQQRNTLVVRRAHIQHSGFDHSIWGRSIAAHVLWLQGLLDHSAQATRDVLAQAEASDHPVSLCLALGWCGYMISFRLGNLEIAERSIVRLKDCAEKNALGNYYAWGVGFEGQLSARQGNIEAGERLLRTCLDGLRQAQFEVIYTPFLSALAEVLVTAGRLGESLAVADEALQRTERNDGFWWMPEALRIKGKVLLSSNDGVAAEAFFRQSLELAHRQQALSWELRSAMDLGQLHHAQGRSREARDLLESVYVRFTEGFETADLQSARRLLKAWAPGGGRRRKI